MRSAGTGGVCRGRLYTVGFRRWNLCGLGFRPRKIILPHFSFSLARPKVKLTGGNRSSLTGYRSNRSGPVPVSAGTQPAKIQILNLNLKNEKFLKNF